MGEKGSLSSVDGVVGATLDDDDSGPQYLFIYLIVLRYGKIVLFLFGIAHYKMG